MGIKWLKLAAEQGNEDAIFDLGIKYIWAAKSATRTFPKDCDF
jgi:TPR repeat protein